MTRRAPRLPVCLLVFLLMTWGTCPCVFAQMLGLEAEQAIAAEQAPVSTAPC